MGLGCGMLYEFAGLNYSMAAEWGGQWLGLCGQTELGSTTVLPPHGLGKFFNLRFLLCKMG